MEWEKTFTHNQHITNKGLVYTHYITQEGQQ